MIFFDYDDIQFMSIGENRIKRSVVNKEVWSDEKVKKIFKLRKEF